jgi:hypothetical protein
LRNYDRFGNEIQGAPGLTVAETPTDTLDGLGEASANLAISFRGVGQHLVAWALMLRPPMFRSRPFLIIAIASSQPVFALPSRSCQIQAPDRSVILRSDGPAQ